MLLCMIRIITYVSLCRYGTVRFDFDLSQQIYHILTFYTFHSLVLSWRSWCCALNFDLLIWKLVRELYVIRATSQSLLDFLCLHFPVIGKHGKGGRSEI